MRRSLAVTVAVLMLALLPSCNGDSPTAPAPAPNPTPTTYTINATVQDATSGIGIALAGIRVVDGQFAGQAFTVGENGTIAISNAQGNMNLEATATGYLSARGGVGPTNSSITISLNRGAPWLVSGSGATVFNGPVDIRRVRVMGTTTESSEIFRVTIGGRIVASEVIGTCCGNNPTLSGIFSVPTPFSSGTPGEVEVEGNNTTWSIEQVYR